MALGRCTSCDKAKDDVLECAVQIAGRRKEFRLCAECRIPFETLMDSVKGKGRGTRRSRRVVPINPADIPLDRPPTKLRPIRLTDK